MGRVTTEYTENTKAPPGTEGPRPQPLAGCPNLRVGGRNPLKRVDCIVVGLSPLEYH